MLDLSISVFEEEVFSEILSLEYSRLILCWEFVKLGSTGVSLQTSIFYNFFNSYLTASRSTFGHYRGDSLTHPMLITGIWRFVPEGHRKPSSKVVSQSLADRLVGWTGNLPVLIVTPWLTILSPMYWSKILMKSLDIPYQLRSDEEHLLIVQKLYCCCRYKHNPHLNKYLLIDILSVLYFLVFYYTQCELRLQLECHQSMLGKHALSFGISLLLETTWMVHYPNVY